MSFSNWREVIPKYAEIFGKRPDVINYNNDVLALIKKGVTSFHSSEELWNDPLRLSTELNAEKMNKLRKGWDLILDIDCKFLEYSRIAAELLVAALKFHGIESIGIKYSGNKGFHIGLSYEAFPEKVNGIEIKNFFPEGPRIIAGYLSELIKKHLSERILNLTAISDLAKNFGKKEDEMMGRICKECGKEASERIRVIFECGECRNTIENNQYFFKENIRCHRCNSDNLREVEKKKEFICRRCNIKSDIHPDSFELGKFNPYSILDIDTILISPRHLFRMPYSLHEKTGFASIVITPNQLKEFHPEWAKPHRVIPKNFLPKPEKDEAKRLIREAFDWHEKNRAEKEFRKAIKAGKEEINYSEEGKKLEFKGINPEFYPPCIKKILEGMKEDGRKRALFVLINFLRSISMDTADIEKKIEEWNKINYKPLKKGYVIAQLDWFKKHKVMLPPNCDKQHYKGIGICSPNSLCQKSRNPVYYARNALVQSIKDSEPQKKRKSFKEQES